MLPHRGLPLGGGRVQAGVAAARTLRWSELRAEVTEDADPVVAKLRLWQAHQASGLSELEQAWVIRALYREDCLSQPQIWRCSERPWEASTQPPPLW